MSDRQQQSDRPQRAQPTVQYRDGGDHQAPGLDHAWVVERLDRRLSFEMDGRSLWLAQAHCALCGVRVTFQSAAVPPCQPGDRR